MPLCCALQNPALGRFNLTVSRFVGHDEGGAHLSL